MATKTSYWLIGGIATLILLTMSTANKAFGAVTANNLLRGKDPLGDGAFGAPRSGGTRKHSGIDIKSTPGENIFSPIAGKVTRIAYPYASDLKYTGLEIVNTAYKVKMFYLAPIKDIVGKQVAVGQVIGTAQNISAKHGAAMINHVHFEVYDVATGKLIDPTKMI